MVNVKSYYQPSLLVCVVGNVYTVLDASWRSEVELLCQNKFPHNRGTERA